MSVQLKDQIHAEVDQLPEHRLRQVLDSVCQMRQERPRGLTVKEFVDRFGGTIPFDELDRMDRAIEEAFESVETDA